VIELGVDALRRMRERRQHSSHLIDVAPDAPMEKPEQSLHVWTGEKFIPWQKWAATDAIVRIEPPERDAAASTAPAARREEKRNGRRVEAPHLFAAVDDEGGGRSGDDELALDGQ